jgi:hypothetical protein
MRGVDDQVASACDGRITQLASPAARVAVRIECVQIMNFPFRAHSLARLFY